MTRFLMAVTLAITYSIDVDCQPADSPPTPYEDADACPFEGCVYREWRAQAAIDAHAQRRGNSAVVFRVAPGEAVVALTGVVVTVRAGRVQFEKPHRLDARPTPIDIVPGQTLFLLTYQGEGFTKAWFNGQLYTDVDISSVVNGVCDLEPTRCSGKIVEASSTEWWVQIRNKSGKVGWILNPEKFDGMDQFGMRGPDQSLQRFATVQQARGPFNIGQ